MANIKAYARIRPTSKASEHYTWDKQKVCLSLPNQPSLVQHLRRDATTIHDFEFTSVFGPTATQQQVFDVVASNIIKGFLGGYNGTIFAYGQTGSGKTYTIEGAAHRYEDRGLASRALSVVYKLLESSSYEHASIHVSYLEIYQEVGYDLLNPTTRPGNVVAHLPKVTVIDGPHNSCIIRNLSTHLAADERVAQSLLLQGQSNRKVAETPSNQRSSRSHAIFSIYLTARDKDSDAITRSKLHLVDLAGSERVAKTKIKGKRLGEAKFINLSLHHLESVIISLQKGSSDIGVRARGNRTRSGRQRSRSAGPIRNKMRIGSATSMRSLPYARSTSLTDLIQPRHIPYRNSLLTMVLKDSLGGNCLTAMIATLSIEDVNIGESLSTCRFAMRVVCIENHASRNESLDDKTVIKRLRKQVTELESEVARLKQGQDKQEDSGNHSIKLAPNKYKENADDVPKVSRYPGNYVTRRSNNLASDERSQCVKVMHGFIGGRVKDPLAAGINDVPKLHECLHLLKKMILQSYAGQRQPESRDVSPHPNAAGVRTQYPSNKSKHNRTRSAPNVSGGRSNMRVISTYGHIPAYVIPTRKNDKTTVEKMTKRVEKKHRDLSQQKRSLAEFQASLKEQQLEILQYELKLKVSAAQEHVRKQRNVISTLKKNRADRDEMLMEKTVEKQLVKRLNKYERRLEHVRNQLHVSDNHLQLRQKSGITKSDTHKDVEKRVNVGIVKHKVDHSHHRKAKSEKVDSRKLIDSLKREERKQEKIQSKINEERLLAVADHIGMKEASTLQKLRDFRSKLKSDSTNDVKTPTGNHSAVDSELHPEARRMSPRNSHSVGLKLNPPQQRSVRDHVIHAWDAGDNRVNGSDISPIKSDNQRNMTDRLQYPDDPRSTTEIRCHNRNQQLAKEQKHILTSTPMMDKRNFNSKDMLGETDFENIRLNQDMYDQSEHSTESKDNTENTKPQEVNLPLKSFSNESDNVSQINFLPSGSLNSRSIESFTSSEYQPANSHQTRLKPQSSTSDIGSMFSLDSKSFDSALSSMLQDESLSIMESPSSSSVWNPSTQSRQSSMDSRDWRAAVELTNGRGDAKLSSNGIGSSRMSLVSRSTLASSTSGSSEIHAVQLKDKLAEYIGSNNSSSCKKSPILGMPSTRTHTIPAADQWNINSKTFCSPSMETLSSNYTTVSAPPSFGEDQSHQQGNSIHLRNPVQIGSSNQSKPDYSNWNLESVQSGKQPSVSLEAAGIPGLMMSSQFTDSTGGIYKESNLGKPIESLGDEDREMTYSQIAKENRQRVAKMRKAMTAAETIQKAWRNRQAKK
ncbi:uncharacterized protein [Amphiura filiformis]|uniref:uncharacterized protein n=1 Tax=Amphiura filiformis TaxID=82378 RepID=UPI003B212AA2